MLSRKTLLACSLAACFSIPHGEAAAQFNQFYFFGDSLTDARNTASS